MIYYCLIGMLLGAISTRLIQKFIGEYDKIKLAPAWLVWLIGEEFMWKKYRPNNLAEIKRVTNQLKEQYPILTIPIEIKNVELNHKTLRLNISSILNRFNK